MKISNAHLQELKKIMKEEYKYTFETESDLEKFAYSLIGYFELALKAKAKKVLKSSSQTY